MSSRDERTEEPVAEGGDDMEDAENGIVCAFVPQPDLQCGLALDKWDDMEVELTS